MSKLSGTLAVVVLKARNLRDKHTFTKQDPFVSIQLGTRKESTPIDRRGGQHPVWDYELRLPISQESTKAIAGRTLTVRCYAKESREDELIGEGTVDLTETLETCEFDDWVPIYDSSGGSPLYRGEIYLEMTFFVSGRRSGNEKRDPTTRRLSKLTNVERMHHQNRSKRLPKADDSHLLMPQPRLNDFSEVDMTPEVSPSMPVTRHKQHLNKVASSGQPPVIPNRFTAEHIPAALRAGLRPSLPQPPYIGIGPPDSDLHHPHATGTAPSLYSQESQTQIDEDRILAESLAGITESTLASQELADEELATMIAHNEGIDVQALRESEQIYQADEELARSLAQ